jgi:hypothetical protein
MNQGPVRNNNQISLSIQQSESKRREFSPRDEVQHRILDSPYREHCDRRTNDACVRERVVSCGKAVYPFKEHRSCRSLVPTGFINHQAFNLCFTTEVLTRSFDATSGFSTHIGEGGCCYSEVGVRELHERVCVVDRNIGILRALNSETASIGCNDLLTKITDVGAFDNG